MKSDFLVSVCVSLACSGLGASQVISPSGESNAEQPYPFLTGSDIAPSLRYQQVYHASDFTHVGMPLRITDVIFAPGSSPMIGAATLPNIQITFSITAAEPDSLSPVFVQNIGANSTVVFSGSLAFSRDPQYGFRYHIGFSTPFDYNPGLGHLLLDVRNYETPPNPGPWPLGGVAGVESPGDSVSSLLALNVNATSAEFVQTAGLRTTFIVTPIPEPNMVWLLAVAFVAGGWTWRRHNLH